MNDTVMKDAFGQLGDTAIAFICDEFAITEEEFKAKTEDELDALYDQLCDIEAEETPIDGKQTTERGEMTSSIVTIVGNYFADKLGYADDDEFERFLAEEDEE